MSTDSRPETEPAAELIVRGTKVTTDADGNVCLNDLWKLAGEPANARPTDWHRHKRTQALESALQAKMVENLHYSSPPLTFYVSGKGRGSRSYTHAVLALDYAALLEPALGVEIHETFLRFRANDVSLALEIVEKLSEQMEYDDLRVKLRRLVKDHNIMSAGVAKEGGVKNFEAYNGAGLSGLYGGMTKADLLRHKGLPGDADRLEHANHEELAANYFKATQAIAKLKREKIQGQAAANQAHNEVGKAVRQTIANLGGTMPENEPALEHIKEAEKRLKASQQPAPKAVSSSRETKQAEKFFETARDLGCNEDEDAFDEIVKKVAKAPPPRQDDKPKQKRKPAK